MKELFDNPVNFAFFTFRNRIHVNIRIHVGMEKVEGILHAGRKGNDTVCAVLNQVSDEGVDAFAVADTAFFPNPVRHVILGDDAGTDGVIQIVIDVGDPVTEADYRCLTCVIGRTVSVVENAHAGFVAEIQPVTVPLQIINNPKTLLIVLEALREDPVQGALTGVAKGRMAEIVTEGDGFHQILVQTKCPGNRSGKTADLQRVGKAGTVMISLRAEKNLGFMLETPKGF